ncbi:hypothetical protein LTR10_022904 [Elasticomyces elasticus]|uniref:Cytochrome P450 n=1 Tax=Exophiala sideris TaxID=1016849 RepID=A0ABR0JKZ8_9EURO|nr:hypothetical protein LTR10_022904 [Elasticomyces elasticus]KAK5032186.1 hypothetical protein LTR13_007403 [Exophiala sideris]KAK5036184.1 hypothetical protein LTS07_001909 [Exophiala sideris]KAK5066567.1 hypothetical protein LTR69_001913 [Exophiala sideris]KAK5180389.1 hypothetical protein LTR44_007146 [Eurotiomycetes sp. CCFEE 6388]
MIWTTAATLLFSIILFYSLTKEPKIHRNGEKLKRPPNTLPVLGNAIVFLRPRHVLFDWFVKCQQIFGRETFEISVPSLPPGVVINSPENLEFVLKNESIITKGDFFKQRSWDLFGYGIINATGDSWRAQRKAGVKFFTAANLDALIEHVMPTVYQDTTRKQLLEAVRDGSVIDLQKVLLDLTTTVVGHMAYDMEIDASSPFGKAFDHASDHVGLRFQNPLYWLTEMFTGASFRSSLAEVRRFSMQIVTNARKRRSRAAFESLITEGDGDTSTPPSDPCFGSLIDSLIESFAEPQVVADAALNFLSAGRDTTAQSFTWMFYALMRHPEALKEVRKEVDEKVSNIEDIDISLLQPATLPLTLATYYEALRLYPPIPFELKQTSQPVTLPDGTFLPANALVVWCIYAFNRAVEIYGDDAHLFRPGRWLDEDGKLVPRSFLEFPVFNGGPRSCLGKKMAELMGVWVMVRMCSEWDFDEVMDGLVRVDDNGKEIVRERVSANSLTLPMEGGLPCRVRMRDRKVPQERKVNGH